jgi:hypothetical protein
MGMMELETRADFRIPGIWRFPMCVLAMMALSGRETWMLLLFDVGVTSLRLRDTLKKCPAAPVSIIVSG